MFSNVLVRMDLLQQKYYFLPEFFRNLIEAQNR